MDEPAAATAAAQTAAGEAEGGGREGVSWPAVPLAQTGIGSCPDRY